MFNTRFKQHKNTYKTNKHLPANLLKIYLQPIPNLDYNQLLFCRSQSIVIFYVTEAEDDLKL